MELKVLLLLFLRIGFCYTKPFLDSETVENNGSSPNAKVNINEADVGHHISLGPESPWHPIRDETPPSPDYPQHPENPLEVLLQPTKNLLALPTLLTSFIEGDFSLARGSRDTRQVDFTDNSENTNLTTLSIPFKSLSLNLSDLNNADAAGYINESSAGFLQPSDENITDIKPELPVQLFIEDVADFVASNMGDVVIIPPAKPEDIITPTDDLETGDHIKSDDGIAENSPTSEVDSMTAFILPVVEDEHQSGTILVRNADKSNILDNVNAADFIQSESSDKKPDLPKPQSEFDRSDWGSSSTADNDESEEDGKIGDRFAEENLAVNDSEPHVPAEQDNVDDNSTTIFTISSSLLRSFLPDNVSTSDLYNALPKEREDKGNVSDPYSYGNNSGIIEKFSSEEEVQLGCTSVEGAPHNFKHLHIIHGDYNEEDGSYNPKKVEENASIGKRTKRSLLSLIQSRILTDDSISDAERSENSAFSATNETETKSIESETETGKEEDKSFSKGLLFGSLADELSQIVKSPRRVESHQRKDIATHSNDKFEEQVIQSAVQTIINDVAGKLKLRSDHSTKENTTDSSQTEHHEQLTPSKTFLGLIAHQIYNNFQKFPFFQTLTEEERITANLKYDKSAQRLSLTHKENITDISKENNNETHTRVARSPSREQVSPFFDQVLDDGSLPEEHINNTNTNSGTPKQEQEKHNNEESKPKTLFRTVVNETIRISDAAKTFINDRFGRSIVNSTHKYIVDDGVEKDAVEISYPESHDNDSSSEIYKYNTSQSGDESHTRKRRSVNENRVKSEINQDEIEDLKEKRDVKKEIIKLAHESALDQEQQKSEDPKVAYMNDEWLKEIMPWVQEDDYPYAISFGEDTPFNETAETPDNTDDIPTEFDESIFVNTDYKTQSIEKILEDRAFKESDTIKNAAVLKQGDESEDDSYEDVCPILTSGHQKYPKIESVQSRKFDIDFIERRPLEEPDFVQNAAESEQDDESEDHSEGTEESLYHNLTSDNQKESKSNSKNETGPKFISFQVTNIEAVEEPKTQVNDDGEELDDEGNVYPNVSHLAYF